MTPDQSNILGGSARNVLSLALIVIGAVAMYNWAIRPHIGYLHAVQRLEPVVSEMAAEKDRVCASLQAKRLQWRTREQELAQVREKFFTYAEFKVFVDHLQALVEETGCVLIVADFAGPDDSRPVRDPDNTTAVQTSHVSLTLQGQYDQIVALLERLRNSRQKVWVDSCHIGRSGTAAGQLTCHLALTTYTVPEPGEPNP